MTTPSVSMVGDKQIRATLNQLSNKVAQRIMVKAVRKGLLPVKQEAKRLANTLFKSNSLSKLITIKAGKTKRGDAYGKVYVSPTKGQRNIKLDGREVPLAVAANIQEFGRKDGSLKPHAFMRPALDSKRGEAMARLTLSAKLELNKEVKKAIKKGKIGSLF